MGFFGAILDAIANNYIFFVAITIFLVLSLIGFYVDKKTRKDADITPIFGKKVSLNIKKRDPSDKKGKKDKKGKQTFTTTVVGGGQGDATVGVSAMANQNLPVGNGTNPTPQVGPNANQMAMGQNVIYNQNMQMGAQAPSYYGGDAGQIPMQTQAAMPVQNEVVQTLPDGTPVDPSLFANIPGQDNSSVMAAAQTAQIENTILPNVATDPVQAQVQGVSSAAPVMEAIVPNVQPQKEQPFEQNAAANEGMNFDMGADNESSAMNFDMSGE